MENYNQTWINLNPNAHIGYLYSQRLIFTTLLNRFNREQRYQEYRELLRELTKLSILIKAKENKGVDYCYIIIGSQNKAIKKT